MEEQQSDQESRFELSVPSRVSQYTPPPLNREMPEQPLEAPRKKGSVVGIIVAGIAIAAIIILAGLLYYYAVHAPQVPQVMPAAQEVAAGSPATATDLLPANATAVVAFAPPAELPAENKNGNCWIRSLAQPYRSDAWRCAVGAAIYDPCFQTGEANQVFCQMNPRSPTQFSITLTKPLPQVPFVEKSNEQWAWFLTLADNTPCSPYTDDRPVVEGIEALYGCRSPDANQVVVLVGDLVKAPVWTASKAVLEQQNGQWLVISRETVEITSVWQ